MAETRLEEPAAAEDKPVRGKLYTCVHVVIVLLSFTNPRSQVAPLSIL